MTDAKRATEHQDNEADSAEDTEEYDELMLLDRLESLEDEMLDLGVTTLDELRGRIRELHEKQAD